MSKYRVWIDVATAAADRREREKWTLWCLAQLQKWPSILEYTAEQPKLEASANSRICEAKHSTPTTELRKCVSQLYYRSSLGLSQEKKLAIPFMEKNIGSHKINGRYLSAGFFLFRYCGSSRTFYKNGFPKLVVSKHRHVDWWYSTYY